MKILDRPYPLPPCIEAITADGVTYAIEDPRDYSDAKLPAGLRSFFAARPPPGTPDPDADLREQFEAQRQQREADEWLRFKQRAGAPAYKAAALKVAAEKLQLLKPIEAAIDALVAKAADKALRVWWEQIDAISRADAQWQQIEAAVTWPGKNGADPLFALAAQLV